MTDEQKAEKDYYEMHQMGARGIFYVYNWIKLGLSIPFLFSFFFSSLGTGVMVRYFPKLIFNSIAAMLELNIAVFPCLLGFTIGGYALVVGFAGVGDLKKFTEKAKEEKGSFFQLLIAIFSVSIFLQFFAVIVSYLVSFIVKSKFNLFLFGGIEKDFFLPVNAIIFFVIAFSSLWAFFTIPYVIVNLFNFAQTNHSISYTEREQDEKNGTDSEYQIKLLEEIVKALQKDENNEHHN